MMNVKTKMILIFTSFVFLTCKNRTEMNQKYNKNIYLDVIGDSKIDTLQLRTIKGNTEIFLVNKGLVEKLMIIYPLLNEKFKTTIPPIEIVYIEANYVQTEEKSFRVKIRNTDFQPDYYYLDISVNSNEFHISNLGVINSIDSVYIKNKKVNYSLKNVLDKNNGINILNFIKKELNF